MASPQPFDQFMAQALYGPNGFYTSVGRAGRRGDFITSAEVGPLFGVVLGNMIEGCRQELGLPDDFTVVEVGAGPGTLARAIGASPNYRYVAVEVSESQRQLHPPWVTSVDSLPNEPFCGIVLANELLDNLPFRLAVFDGAWREVFVAEHSPGDFSEVLSAPIDPLPSYLPRIAPHGARVPLQDRAAAWVHQVRKLADRVVTIDYCTAQTAELASLPWRSWLRTYRGHERGVHYLRDVGLQDITAQVCMDQLPLPTASEPQSAFLTRWGIDDLVAEGKREWARLASAPTVQALRMRSRVSEAEALQASDGLGGFVVATWDSDSLHQVS